METKSTFSILFYLRRDRIDDKSESPIYLRITVDRESSSINIGRRANAKAWDANKGYCTAKHPDADEVNSFIDLMRKRVYEARIQLIENNKIVSSYALVSLMNSQKEKKLTILSIGKQHNQRMEALIGKSSSYGNYKNYKTTLKSMEAFILYKYRVADMPLNDLSQRFLNDFIEYLMTISSHPSLYDPVQIPQFAPVFYMWEPFFGCEDVSVGWMQGDFARKFGV
jgi:hypothetical protein